MAVVIRADASTRIGIGHVMRCLTLADALQGRGVDVVFVCREFTGHCIPLIQDRGYGAYVLEKPSSSLSLIDDGEPDHALWLEVSWQQDAEETLSILKRADVTIDSLVIDHYALDFRWHQFFRQHTQKIMVIDDLEDRKHDCDVLLDQTYGRSGSDYQGLVPEGSRVLLGANYALLRPQFVKKRQKSIDRRGGTSNIRRILVSMGGDGSGGI